MKKLSFVIEQPQIEINGIVFDLQKSDADIFTNALEISEKYKDLDVSDQKLVLKAFREVTGYVDAILGKGALAKISGGKPVSLTQTIEIMTEIARAATESYADYVKEQYE